LGDGVVQTEAGLLHIPYALPGETVQLHDNALPEVLTGHHPERVQPPCPHFGTCGGCSLQHMSRKLQSEFKLNTLIKAFEQAGLTVTPEPVIEAPADDRRRLTFAAQNTASGVAFGFHKRKSHDIVDIDDCVIARPAIRSQLSKLKQLAKLVADGKGKTRLVVTESLNGIDVCVLHASKHAVKNKLSLVERFKTFGFARLSFGDEILIELRPPSHTIGQSIVTPPPGSFLQASPYAENSMANLVLQGIGKAKKVADLFSGSGTFALRLSEKAEVHAVESDANALQALEKAWKAAGASGLKRITFEKRDLFRRPLMPQELERFQAVVFDPPRAGAEAQCERLAKSTIKTIVAVSCNPTTLARDAAILIKGGYKLTSLVPIDQFVYSPHLEAVAVLRR
jgi:23S rRNA (uracil1939-C5)-methyltransferase